MFMLDLGIVPVEEVVELPVIIVLETVGVLAVIVNVAEWIIPIALVYLVLVVLVAVNVLVTVIQLLVIIVVVILIPKETV